MAGAVTASAEEDAADRALLRGYWSHDALDGAGQAGGAGRGSMSDELLVRYAELDGAHIAWTATGSGPPLVVTGWWCSHLALNWADPGFRDYIERLARHRTVIRYDRPGTGLSGAGTPPASLEEEHRALSGLLEALGLGPVALLAGSSGCATAAVYAARHPGDVERLVLCGGYARGADISPPSARDALIAAVRAHWGLGSRLLADVFLPDATARERAEFAEFQRRCMSPEEAAGALRAVYAFDCTPELAAVAVPTLVLHRRGDRAIPFALGKDLAASIPGAEFRALDGADHFPWRGDRAEMAEEAESFFDGAPPRRRRPAPPAEQQPVARLTPREREVLALIARGATDLEIAASLVLSPHTVHRHVANIRTKLGVPSRAAAAAWASAHDLL